MTTWKALAWAGAAVATALGGTCVLGCSSSSSSPAAAGGPDATDFDALPPLGVGQASCTPADCPPPATCAGALIGPNTPITYCTLQCSKASECPPGDTCAPLGIGQCLKACTADSDCSGGFGCRPDAGYCYSPYNGADAIPDASADTAPAEASANVEAGPVEAGGGSDAGPADAGSSDASEASVPAEAGTDGGSGDASAD